MSIFQEEWDERFKGQRFQVKEYPYVISTGNFYVVIDTMDEMKDISFDSDWDEAEKFCIFINELYDKCKKIDVFEEKVELLKLENNVFFQSTFDILLKYQHLFNREMADEILEELGIELTMWFE